MKKNETGRLAEIAARIRKAVVGMACASQASHVGSALSIVDILTVLYFRVMRLDPHRAGDENRDRLILSKGHAAMALYAALAERGFFKRELLREFFTDGGVLAGHPYRNTLPGLEVTSGSLGHGLALACGLALADRMDGRDSTVYVIMGDGELDEGSVWEALLYAAHQKLARITVIIDYNKWQACGRTNEVVNLEPLKGKLQAFNWTVAEIDGHDYTQIEKALRSASGQPKAVIAHTVKGKGVRFMEDKLEWHYRAPDRHGLDIALDELDGKV